MNAIDWPQRFEGKTVKKVEVAEADGEVLQVAIMFTDRSLLVVERNNHGSLYVHAFVEPSVTQEVTP
jgi:hypothetical protein